MLKNISDQAENKVSYTYKKRFCGLYTEMQRTGKIKREDSWEKFVNPNKIGLDNHLQKAYNSSNQGQVKTKANSNGEEDQRQSKAG